MWFVIYFFYFQINKTTLRGYDNDQLAYISFSPTFDGLNNALQDKERWVKIIRQFPLIYNLLLNDSKMEIILIGNKKLLEKEDDISLKMGTISISLSKTIKNLGVIFDSQLSFKEHFIDIF